MVENKIFPTHGHEEKSLDKPSLTSKIHKGSVDKPSLTTIPSKSNPKKK